MKKTWKWLAVALALALALALTACQKKSIQTPGADGVSTADGNAAANEDNEANAPDDAPPEDAPVEGLEGDGADTLPPEEPETPLSLFNTALLEGFSDEMASSQWFFAYGLENDNDIEAIVSLPQESGDADAAFRMANSYYAAAKTAADKAGVRLTSYECTVLNDGATVGVYTTSDGVSYTAVVNGETTTLKAG